MPCTFRKAVKGKTLGCFVAIGQSPQAKIISQERAWTRFMYGTSWRHDPRNQGAPWVVQPCVAQTNVQIPQGPLMIGGEVVFSSYQDRLIFQIQSCSNSNSSLPAIGSGARRGHSFVPHVFLLPAEAYHAGSYVYARTSSCRRVPNVSVCTIDRIPITIALPYSQPQIAEADSCIIQFSCSLDRNSHDEILSHAYAD